LDGSKLFLDSSKAYIVAGFTAINGIAFGKKNNWHLRVRRQQFIRFTNVKISTVKKQQ